MGQVLSHCPEYMAVSRFHQWTVLKGLAKPDSVPRSPCPQLGFLYNEAVIVSLDSKYKGSLHKQAEGAQEGCAAVHEEASVSVPHLFCTLYWILSHLVPGA